MIKAMRFNGSQSFLCGCLLIFVWLSCDFRLAIASLIHYQGNVWKVARIGLQRGYLWLVCGLYDGIGAAGIRVHAGRFTLYFSDFILLKPLSNLSKRHLKISTPNRRYQGRGYVSISIYKVSYIPYTPYKNQLKCSILLLSVTKL